MRRYFLILYFITERQMIMSKAISLIMFVVGLGVFGLAIMYAYQEPQIRHKGSFTASEDMQHLSFPARRGGRAHIKTNTDVVDTTFTIPEVTVVGNVSKPVKRPAKKVEVVKHEMGFGTFSLPGALEYNKELRKHHDRTPNIRYSNGAFSKSH